SYPPLAYIRCSKEELMHRTGKTRVIGSNQHFTEKGDLPGW
ncbi:unnamed protein product, partial [marine sediment metagenome]